MSPQSRIQKGKDLENYVCERLQEKGLDEKAVRSHGSGNGNREKSDIWTSLTILGRNAGFECKNQKKASIKDWWEQTQKLEVLGREPVLVYKLGGESLEETKVVIYLDTFLDLLKALECPPQSSEAPEQENIPRELRWRIQEAITANKRLLHELDK